MKNIPFFKKLFSAPLSNTQISTFTNSDELRKIHLIQLFNLVALVFVFPLSLKAFIEQEYSNAIPLLFVGLVILANYYYLKITSNENIASHTLSIIFFGLMIYLVYTGGVSHTGPLWISSLPLIVFFLLGTRRGFVYIFIFSILLLIILYLPFDALLKVEYSHNHKLRIILSFLLITFLASMYEYSNAKAFTSMQKLKEELEYSSTRDYLTSLYNRRGYDKKIKNIKNAQGVVLMCDIDHFKKINDNYGHDVGDFVLQEVARKIKNILREDDMAVRWGGEEFFIFLHHASIEDGHLVAEKIRKSIENLLLRHDDEKIDITISIGLEEISKNVDLENAIANADNAMYQAKQAGRNIVTRYAA